MYEKCNGCEENVAIWAVDYINDKGQNDGSFLCNDCLDSFKEAYPYAAVVQYRYPDTLTLYTGE